jgi:hypothetical protein
MSNTQMRPAVAGPLEPTVRPCPFCGGTDGTDEQGETYRWRLWRCSCGATGPEVRCYISGSGQGGVKEARQIALSAWNERTVTPEVIREAAATAAATERHACAIAVWMVKMEATEPDADDRGVAGWLDEAEQRVKRRAQRNLDGAASV